MKLIDNIHKEDWNKFIGGQEYSQFLQSWQWGDFQEKTGQKVYRFGIEEDGVLLAAATLIKKNILGDYGYLYCPRGPITKLKVESEKLKVYDFLFKEIRNIAENEKAVFFRFDPVYLISNKEFDLKKTIDVQPSKTSLIDLTKSEDEILGGMHQKTRYNIRLAEKKGVKVFSSGKEDFAKFWTLMKDTEARDGFRLHNRSYYERMIDLDPEFIRVYLAEWSGRLIAGVIAAIFGDTVFYIHGASANECRETMAPYALQWHLIKTGKELGCNFYDLYGIDEKKWPGVTRFKIGFGGTEKQYPGTYDLPFQNSYYHIYKAARAIRRSL